MTVARGGKKDVLDPDTRRVDAAELPKEVTSPVELQLLELIPNLERHFKVTLATCERPQFLMYGEGDFYKLHRDSNSEPDAFDYLQRRKVSAVVFLNGQTETSGEGFGQGHLTFHGLLKAPPWEMCPLPLHAESGLLVAFPSDLWHEVTPVMFGQRFTIVTWFFGPELERVPLPVPVHESHH